MMVRLEAYQSLHESLNVMHFNSMMVRLEEPETLFTECTFEDFNSMMVRLEVINFRDDY